MTRAALLTFLLAAFLQETPAPRPNIVLCMADDLG